MRQPSVSTLPRRGMPSWLLFAAVIAAAAVGASAARDHILGPDAWAHVGRMDRCEVYENRFTARIRLECPPLGGRYA